MPRSEGKVSEALQLNWCWCQSMYGSSAWQCILTINVTFLEAVKLQTEKLSWLGTGPEHRCRAFNLPIIGKMEEDKIPIQPLLHGPMWSHCNPTFGELREFLKRRNIFKYGLILTQIPSLLLIVRLTESKWCNLVVLPILSSFTNIQSRWQRDCMGNNTPQWQRKKRAHVHTKGTDYVLYCFMIFIFIMLV